MSNHTDRSGIKLGYSYLNSQTILIEDFVSTLALKPQL